MASLFNRRGKQQGDHLLQEALHGGLCDPEGGAKWLAPPTGGARQPAPLVGRGHRQHSPDGTDLKNHNINADISQGGRGTQVEEPAQHRWHCPTHRGHLNLRTLRSYTHFFTCSPSVAMTSSFSWIERPMA